MIKLDRFDVHDRLTHFKKQEFSIGECCQDLINKAPFGNRPFYIFAHARTDDDGFTKRIIWQPRLIRPLAQTNSMLFKGRPGSDIIDVIWMIPPREMWDQYQKGKITFDQTVFESIHAFNHNREELERPDSDDPSDEMARAIYVEVVAEAKRARLMGNLWK